MDANHPMCKLLLLICIFTLNVLLFNTVLNKGVGEYNSPLNARYKRTRIIDGFL